MLKLEKKRKFKLSQAKKRMEYKIESRTNYQDEHDQQLVKPIVNDDQVNNCTNIIESLNKPAWALTESSAQNKCLSQEAVEEDGLLNFIDSLDLETMYQDMELNILVNHLKERINKLEADRKSNQDQLRNLCDVSLSYLNQLQFFLY